MHALLAAVSAALVAFTCGAPPEPQIGYVEGGFCPVPYEAEASRAAWVTVATGLAQGDCIELPEGVAWRLCCPASSGLARRCGPPARPLAAQPSCTRVIVP